MWTRRWANDEYARGCYGGYLPPGGWTSYGKALREPVGPIHWAGARPPASGPATWKARSSRAAGPPQRIIAAR